MKKVLAILLTYSVASYSDCRVNENKLDQSYRTPTAAKTLSIGIIKKKNDKLFFVSDYPWKKISLEIITEGCIGNDRVQENDKVLFLSKLESEDLRDKKIDRSLGGFVDIADLSGVAEELRFKDEIPAGHANIFWKYCRVDSSCTIINGACGEQIGVNYTYSEKYKNYIKKESDGKKCPSVKNSFKGVIPKCVNYFCSSII